MGQLQKITADLEELGYQIVAISPDRHEKLQASIEKNKLGYVLLSDSKMAAARAFGVAYKLDDGLLGQYKQFGIDLAESSGESHGMLPVPSVFITDGEATIRFSYVDPDYKKRIDPDLLLAAARSIRNP